MEEQMTTTFLDRVKQIVRQDAKGFRRAKCEVDDERIGEILSAVEWIGRTITPDFAIDKDNRFVYTNLVYWMLGDSRMKAFSKQRILGDGDIGKGLYICGPVGSGKTVATEILFKLMKMMHIRYCIGEYAPTDYQWKNVRTDAVVRDFLKSGNLDEYISHPTLCLQDLGSENDNALYMGNKTNVLREILEGRGDRRNSLTIITSNLFPNEPEMVDKYGERAVSRLNSMCNLLVLKGHDRRK